jgi:membrane protein
MAFAVKTTLRNTLNIFKNSFTEFSNDKVLKLSASLAYYTIFSLPSMLIVIIGLCSIFYGKEAIQGQVFYQVKQFVGADAALQIQDILKKTSLHQDNFMATIVGFIILLVSATGIFGEIQDSINTIWGLTPKPRKGFVKLLLNRLLSFSMLVVLGFILLVSLILSALLATFTGHLKYYFSDTLVNTISMFDHVITLAVTSVVFGFIFKALPDAKIHWKDIWVGSLFTSALFMLGKFVISYYLAHTNVINTYGAAGSLIVILLWVYYSAIILYFGAEFTQVYIRFKEKRIEPNKYSIWAGKGDDAEANKASRRPLQFPEIHL